MILTIVLCAVLIGLDRLSKIVAVRYLMPVGTLPAIPGVFEWKYVENTGAAFSLLAGRQTILIIITGIALLCVAYVMLFRRPKDKLEYIGIVLIFSGGVGNFIDRAVQGYVVDFVSLLFMNFAVFNVADIFVCVGFACLVIGVCRSEYRAKKLREAQPKAEEEQTPGIDTDVDTNTDTDSPADGTH